MKKVTTAVVTVAAFAFASSALATMDIQKAYKEKGKLEKAACIDCHKEKMPKKEKADLNDFGGTIKAAKDKEGKIDWTKVKFPEPKKN